MGRVALDHVSKRFDDVVAVDDLSPRRRRRGVPRAARPVGLRQVDRAAHDRRARGADRGHDHHRRPRRQRRRGQGPRRRDGVPELRALPAHDGAAEHRVPAAVAQGAGGRAGAARAGRGREPRRSTTLLDRKPAQLSGGQRQRVALARAIVRRPQAFLMDEPLSNLDAKLRVQTRAELVELQRRLAATIVYVTHDQVEAMTMGHRIAIIDAGRAPAGRRAAGRLRAAGEPVRRPLHRQPADEHRHRPRRPRRRDAGRASSRAAHVPLARGRAARSRRAGLDEVVIGVRPEHLRLAADGRAPGHGHAWSSRSATSATSCAASTTSSW